MARGENVNILLLADDLGRQQRSLTEVLAGLGVHPVTVASREDALRRLAREEFAAVLLGVSPSGQDHFETARLIRQQEGTRETPIIFITAEGDDDHRSRGQALGAVDYLSAPADPIALSSKVVPLVELFKRRQAESLRPSAAGASLDGLRVLIVDDEDDIRECLSVALQQWGASVTAVPSATEALAVLDATLVDVVLCDLGMPGEDGYSLIRRIRARQPERGGRIPAAALTAYTGAEDQVRALGAGFHAHISKPVEPSELAAIVKNLATKRPAQCAK